MGDPLSSKLTTFASEISLPVVSERTKILLKVSVFLLSFISACKIIGYSFPESFKVVTLLPENKVSIDFPID